MAQSTATATATATPSPPTASRSASSGRGSSSSSQQPYRVASLHLTSGPFDAKTLRSVTRALTLPLAPALLKLGSSFLLGGPRRQDRQSSLSPLSPSSRQAVCVEEEERRARVAGGWLLSLPRQWQSRRLGRGHAQSRRERSESMVPVPVTAAVTATASSPSSSSSASSRLQMLRGAVSLKMHRYLCCATHMYPTRGCHFMHHRSLSHLVCVHLDLPACLPACLLLLFPSPLQGHGGRVHTSLPLARRRGNPFAGHRCCPCPCCPDCLPAGSYKGGAITTELMLMAMYCCDGVCSAMYLGGIRIIVLFAA